jgi:hypothetical protein
VRVVIEFRSEKVEEELEKVDNVWLCWATTAGFAEARLLSQPGDLHMRIRVASRIKCTEMDTLTHERIVPNGIR